MSNLLLSKIGHVISEFPLAFKQTKEVKLFMTLLVKNEEGMLEENLQFHKAMGVDGFIITDNNSTDSTPDIIRKYKQKGWIKEVIEEKATNYEQKDWVDRMIWKAKTIYKADWIINADADELWYAPTGNLKDELYATNANVLNCEMRSVYPEEEKPFWQWDKTVKAVTEPEKYDLSLYSLFERQNKKVIHRTAGYLQISMGNHKVTMFPQNSADSHIHVYHYNIRGKQQFMEKMINGGKQLEQHKGRHGGRHWRYFYQLHKEGKLEAEYERVIGSAYFEALRKDGFIIPDVTIPNFFKRLKPDIIMKHAFLIIAHNEYPVLEVLLSMLDDERNDIYLHIDKRATELFQQIKKVKMQKAGFYLIENPIKVYWGDISQVQVEYLLFETALSHGPYAYYHLLSGTDLPIKSQDYIHAFFQQNAGKEFVGFWQDAAHQRDLERKVFRYYFFTKRLKDKEHLLHGITALIRNLILAVQKISHYRRKQTFEFKKGGNWISITENAVKYLLQYKEIVLNRMKYTLCADEIFIQTILWNSPFRERMHCTNNANTGSMREIDWEHGSPYIWQDHDYQTLINSNKIFARKFNSNQMGVVYKIQKLYLKQVPK